MTLNLPDLIRLAWSSVRAPADGARTVMRTPLERQERWMALMLVVVVSVLLGKFNQLVMPTGGGTMVQSFLSNPLAMALVQLSIFVIMVYSIFWIGRAVGGSGSFEDAILLVAWLQFIMVCLQVVQTAALFVLPPLANLIGIAGLGLFFYLLTHFVAVLHGFESLGKVFLMILISIVGIAFGLSLILSMIGFAVPGA